MDCLRNKRRRPGCCHRWGAEDGRPCWEDNSFVFLSAATDTDNTSLTQWQRNTNSDPFICRHKSRLLQLCPIWHQRSTDRTSSENFECGSSSRASYSKVCTSLSIDQRPSTLASSSATNQIQDPATGCKLHTSKGTFVSPGTLCVCWFRRYRDVDTCDLPINSVWWSIAVVYLRCRSEDLLLQDLRRGMICLWLCVSPYPGTVTVQKLWSRLTCSIRQ